MKGLKKTVITLLSALMILTLFVGCSDDSAQESDALGYVSFSDGGSRGLETENQTLYGVEDLYWAYTAEKVRGNYTTGQSQKAESGYSFQDLTPGAVTDGVVAYSCLDGSTMYKLTPVKQGPAKGLAGAVLSPFSVGEWRIKLYGFKSYNAADGKFTEIIYKGTTGSMWVSKWTSPRVPETGTPTNPDDIVTIDKRSSGDDPQILRFSLSGDGAGLGELEFGPIVLTVPEREAFQGPEFGGLTYPVEVTPKIRVIVLDMRNIETGGIPQVIAVSTTPIDFSDFDDTPELAVFTEGQTVKTGNTADALNTFVKVKKDGLVATKPFTASKGGAADTAAPTTGNVNQFKDGIADIAFLTFYQDGYTVGQNTWTMDDVDATNWKDRYDYTAYNPQNGTAPTGTTGTTANGDLTDDTFIKAWFTAAGKMRLNSDDSITGNVTAWDEGDDKLINGWALVGNIAAYPIGFTSGVRTTVGGDLNDLLGAKGETEEVKPGIAVARINWKVVEGQPAGTYNPHAQAGSAWFRADNVGKDYTDYTSLEDAIKDYDDFFTAGTVTDTDGTGSAKVSACVISEKAPYIQLLANVEGAKLQKSTATAGTYAETAHVDEIMLVSGDHFIRDLEILNTTAKRSVVIAPTFVYDETIASTTDLAQKKAKEDAQYTSGKYTFSNENDDGNFNAQVLKNFLLKTDTAWIWTESKDGALTTGGTLKIDGTGYTAGLNVLHSGIASVVEIRNVNNADGANKGYLLATKSDIPAPASETTSIGSLTVLGKGRVELGGRVCVNKLTVSYDSTANVAPVALALNDVVLNAREDATVWQYGYVDYSGSAAMDYVPLRTATYAAAGNKSTTEVFWLDASTYPTGDARAKNAGFKEIVLDGNDGLHNVSAGVDVAKGYMYGIKGLGVELPQFYTPGASAGDPEVALFANADKRFMHWSTKATLTTFSPDNITVWGKRFADKGTVIPGFNPETGAAITDGTAITLYPLWAQPIGGRVFFLNTGFTNAKYRFYGVADGSVNELTEWYDLSGDALIKKLDSAFWYSTTSTTPDEVYVAYAKKVEGAKSVTSEVTFYKASSGSYLFKWDATENDVLLDTAKISDVTASLNPTTAATIIPTLVERGKGRVNTALAVATGMSTLTPATTGSIFWDLFGSYDFTPATYDPATPTTAPVTNNDTTITDSFGLGVKDWFIGSTEDYGNLSVVAPEIFTASGYDIWSSVQSTTESTYTQMEDDGTGTLVPVTSGTDPSGYVQVPYKGHAKYWNKISNGGEWVEDLKTAQHYIIPIRTLIPATAP